MYITYIGAMDDDQELAAYWVHSSMYTRYYTHHGYLVGTYMPSVLGTT